MANFLDLKCVFKHNGSMKSKQIIKAHLQASGETIGEFVMKAGIGKSAFYDFRTGRNPVSLDLVNKMLKVCGYELRPMPIEIAASHSSEAESHD